LQRPEATDFLVLSVTITRKRPGISNHFISTPSHIPISSPRQKARPHVSTVVPAPHACSCYHAHVQCKRNAEAHISPRSGSQAILLGLALRLQVHQPASSDKFHHSWTRLPRVMLCTAADAVAEGGSKSIGAEKLESMGLYIAG
jgi:hypothetical protein